MEHHLLLFVAKTGEATHIEPRLTKYYGIAPDSSIRALGGLVVKRWLPRQEAEKRLANSLAITMVCPNEQGPVNAAVYLGYALERFPEVTDCITIGIAGGHKSLKVPEGVRCVCVATSAFYPEQGRQAMEIGDDTSSIDQDGGDGGDGGGVKERIVHLSALKKEELPREVKPLLEGWVEERREEYGKMAIRVAEFVSGSNVEEGPSDFLEMITKMYRCDKQHQVVEMETYSVFLACKVFGKLCLGSFKGITDTATAKESRANRKDRKTATRDAVTAATTHAWAWLEHYFSRFGEQHSGGAAPHK